MYVCCLGRTHQHTCTVSDIHNVASMLAALAKDSWCMYTKSPCDNGVDEADVHHKQQSTFMVETERLGTMENLISLNTITRYVNLHAHVQWWFGSLLGSMGQVCEIVHKEETRKLAPLS